MQGSHYVSQYARGKIRACIREKKPLTFGKSEAKLKIRSFNEMRLLY